MSKTAASNTFSAYHPIIPKNYTPAWKQDMKNRTLIVENAKSSNLDYNGTESTLFLEKRERLAHHRQNEERNQELVLTKQNNIPPMHSSLSKYQSSLMFRKTDEN